MGLDGRVERGETVAVAARRLQHRRRPIIGAVGLAGFDSAWADFHKLIFSNDFWLLNPSTDHLIQMFPLAFWESIVFLVGTLVVAQAALLLLGAALYLGASRHKEEALELAAA